MEKKPCVVGYKGRRDLVGDYLGQFEEDSRPKRQLDAHAVPNRGFSLYRLRLAQEDFEVRDEPFGIVGIPTWASSKQVVKESLEAIPVFGAYIDKVLLSVVPVYERSERSGASRRCGIAIASDPLERERLG